MPSFNAKEFLTNSQGTPEALANAFGMPSCMLNLAGKVLALLPDDVLQAIRVDAMLGRMAAENDIAAFTAWLRDRLGVFYPFDENGRLKFLSKFSLFGIDFFSLISRVLAYISAIRDYAAAMYANYEAVKNEIEDAKRCLDSYKNSLDSKVGSVTQEELNFSGLDSELDFIQRSVDFVQQATDLINRIDAEFAARAEDPSRGPRFVPNRNVDIRQFANEDEIVQAFTPQEEQEIFRLSYGPPKARYGKFLLTEDGLYYDSQSASEGLSLAFTEIARKKAEFNQTSSIFWTFEHDPNIGGRGKGVSLKQIKEYVDNILDIERSDDSKDLQPFYDQDNYLEQLQIHKNKRVYDLSALVTEIEADNTYSEAEKLNTRQSLLSELAAFSNKVKKRRKQIELAVRLGKNKFTPGNVPINDFSYLAGTNFLVDIQKQRELTLDHDDVNGIIMPVEATYTQPPKDSIHMTIDQLLLSMVGEANILGSASSLEDIKATILRNETEVVKENLVAIYNFLETNVEAASSYQYLLDNCITTNNILNAKLVASSIPSVFSKGLGIPYLDGVVKFDIAGVVEGFSNHVILPPRRELEDLLYSKQGATFDFWIHVPDLVPQNQGTVQQMYKIILANENFGINFSDNKQKNIGYLKPDEGNNVVKGLLIGFTRDRRITLGETPSDLDVSNPGSETCFFITQTQSVDGSSIGFLNKSSTVPNAEDNCISTKESLCFKMNINQVNAEGLAMSAIQDRFCHLSISINPQKNNISVYLDGSLMATSSLDLTFAVSPYKTLNVPTFVIDKVESTQNNSFAYTPRYLGYLSKINTGLEFSDRRNIDTYYKFTPWVIGGGYTDGFNAANSGFLGLTYGGRRSALDGYLGSFKIYNKALNSDQIVNNYRAQSNFFSNIDLTV